MSDEINSHAKQIDCDIRDTLEYIDIDEDVDELIYSIDEDVNEFIYSIDEEVDELAGSDAPCENYTTERTLYGEERTYHYCNDKTCTRTHDHNYDTPKKNLTNYDKSCNDKLKKNKNNRKIQNQEEKPKGETVASEEKPYSDSELIATATNSEDQESLDAASKKLNELQQSVDNLISQEVTPSNMNSYVQKYTNIEQGISEFLESLVPLVEENQKRKQKRDEVEALRGIWDSNRERSQERVGKYEEQYRILEKEILNSSITDTVVESRMENLKYALGEWRNLYRLASTHADRIGREVDVLNQDLQKINKISYQISSFNLRLKTLVFTSKTYASSTGLDSKELNSIQKALSASLQKIENLEKEQFEITQRS